MEQPARHLEDELAEIAERAEPGRTTHLAVRHWGWDGRGGTTLAAAGREFGGITRERVRQLLERLSGHLRSERPPAPALERALVLAAHASPTTAISLGRRLADEHISARPFHPAGLLSAAAVLGRESTFALESVKGVHVVVPWPPDPETDTLAVISAVIDAARAAVRRGGAGRIAEVAGKVAAALGVWVDDELVTAVVSESSDFVWLERRTGWFYLPAVARNAVVTRVMKIMSVAGSVRLHELHAGIRRDERMREFVMPEYILAELCARLPDVQLTGELLTATRQTPPEELLETTEIALLRALEAAGGAAKRHELERTCLAAGMKRSSFNNRIAYSPIIANLGRGWYGVRGRGCDLTTRSGPERGSEEPAAVNHTAAAQSGAAVGPYESDVPAGAVGQHRDGEPPDGGHVPRPGDMASFRSPRGR